MGTYKELLWQLQEAKSFEKPKIKYEQYATSAELAANTLWTIHESYDDIEDKVVVDLGCGCGILGIAADLLGAGQVIGVDIDEDALSIAVENNEEFETNVQFIIANIDNFAHENLFLPKYVDTIIMNPPFGTKDKPGIDAKFVEVALKIAPVVYSLHKSSTRKFFEKKAAEWGSEIEVIAQMKFELPKTYKFHKKKSVDIEVDLYRFERTQN